MEFMQETLQQLINGISLGSIYALIALGYTMIYGIIKLINFAHGDIYMVGAYLGFYAVLITAIGMSFLLEYVTMAIVSPTPRTFPATISDISFDVAGLIISGQQLLIMGVTLVLMLILTYIVRSTKIGKAMRAASYDTEAAQLMGINADRIISITFAIGSALAAVAGVLIGIYYNAIDPLMGLMPGIKAFVAAVFGGIGILPGAVVGGLVLGIVEAFISGFGFSMFRDAAAFAILILVLLVRPAGIFGKNVKEKV